MYIANSKLQVNGRTTNGNDGGDGHEGDQFNGGSKTKLGFRIYSSLRTWASGTSNISTTRLH